MFVVIAIGGYSSNYWTEHTEIPLLRRRLLCSRRVVALVVFDVISKMKSRNEASKADDRFTRSKTTALIVQA